MTQRRQRGDPIDGVVAAEHWHHTQEGRVQCDLCPRRCTLWAGQRAFCFVREARTPAQNIHGLQLHANTRYEGDGSSIEGSSEVLNVSGQDLPVQPPEMVLTAYGRSTGFCVDPIEKKPLNHFYPGTAVLSFGTAGCNLGCKFCQNWDISKARDMRRLSSIATPDSIAELAHKNKCQSVAYTYNDPVIFYEYAVDTARACKEQGIKNVAVTAGYITAAARPGFFRDMDAVNVDLKAFSTSFYERLCAGHLQPVLDTLCYLYHETEVWLELTTLLIPAENDDPDELRRLCDFVAEKLEPTVPLHFSAFHPDYKMQDRVSTPTAILQSACTIAKSAGLSHVYTGNVHDAEGQSSYCTHCTNKVIGRDWYALSAWNLNEQGCCTTCQTPLVGRFSGSPGNFGRKRLPLSL